MAAVVYSFVVRSAGDPTAATGLTPTFVEYRDIESLVDLSASAPTIVEVGNGHYKFEVDWDTVPESTGPSNHVSIVIDAGVALTVLSERYITARINRSDDFASDITSIESAVTTLDSKIDVIDANVDTLVEIETGKWEIVSNQLKIYESDGVTLIKTFNLFDATGSPTSTLPARREPV